MTSPARPQTKGLLEGVRVLEIGNFLAAPFCTMQLADLGAEVIKVENPSGGDLSRQFAPIVAGESAGFMQVNRNKLSVAINLKHPAGQRVLEKLIDDCDVLVENLRPGVLSGLGFGYEQLRARNPRLIYFAASGWGQDGPAADRPGLDIMAQAYSGLMSITGSEDGEPAKAGVPICDLVCALYGAIAIVGALFRRERTGQGEFVDVSLFEAGVSLAVWESGRYFATGEIPRARGTAHQSGAPYQAVKCGDGYVTIGAATPKTWYALCTALGLQSMYEDPRFATTQSRFEHRHELIAEMEAALATWTVADVLSTCIDAGIPAAPIQTYDHVFADPVLTSRGFLTQADHSRAGSYRLMASPMRMRNSPAGVRSAAPALGEHTREVLSAAGLEPDDIDTLFSEGAIG